MSEDNEEIVSLEEEISRLVHYMHFDLGYEFRDAKQNFERDLTQSTFKYEIPGDLKMNKAVTMQEEGRILEEHTRKKGGTELLDDNAPDSDASKTLGDNK